MSQIKLYRNASSIATITPRSASAKPLLFCRRLGSCTTLRSPCVASSCPWRVSLVRRSPHCRHRPCSRIVHGPVCLVPPLVQAAGPRLSTGTSLTNALMCSGRSSRTKLSSVESTLCPAPLSNRYVSRRYQVVLTSIFCRASETPPSRLCLARRISTLSLLLTLAGGSTRYPPKTLTARFPLSSSSQCYRGACAY